MGELQCDVAKSLISSDGTWLAIQYLEELMKECPGVDYRICNSKLGKPNAICWMTPRMRNDLIRYGTVFSLDGKKKQYNKFNWPYIGPVVKDYKNRVRVVCESLLVSEDEDGYVFVLNSLAKMEPRWSLQSLRFIFADHLFQPKVIERLGIQKTCNLRGDYHHLIREVWPKYFGETLLRTISFQLETMLSTEEENPVFMHVLTMLKEFNILKQFIPTLNIIHSGSYPNRKVILCTKDQSHQKRFILAYIHDLEKVVTLQLLNILNN